MHFFLELVFLRYLSSAFDRKHADLLDTPHADAEYRADNVFWMPREARWGTLQGYARSSYVGKRLDDAMGAIERENDDLKGVPPKIFGKADFSLRVTASAIHRDPRVRSTGVEPMLGDEHIEAITTGGPVAGDHQEADVR
jgi:type I restriction enzyme M protein